MFHSVLFYIICFLLILNAFDFIFNINHLLIIFVCFLVVIIYLCYCNHAILDVVFSFRLYIFCFFRISCHS